MKWKENFVRTDERLKSAALMDQEVPRISNVLSESSFEEEL